MSELKRKHKGAATELRAVLWLLDQGYEVFRNVSQHGAIDIIAIRDNVTLRLDVKRSDKERSNDEQINLGVMFIVPLADGTFEIKEPLPPLSASDKVCIGCNRVFYSYREQKFCGVRCRQGWYRRRRARAQS